MLIVPATSAADPPSASGVNPLQPDTVCTDPPEWDSPPSISGTPAFGNTLTTSSGNVFCANSLQAKFYWTDAAGNVLGSGPAKSGATQSCTNVGFVDCSKSDSYRLSTADESYYIKAVWTAVNFNGQTQYATNPIGPLPALSAVTYRILLGGALQRTFEIRYPRCGLGALCANVSSGVEPQPNQGTGQCQQFNVTATQWGATLGSKTTLTPNFHQKNPPGNYPGLSAPTQGTTQWNMVASGTDNQHNCTSLGGVWWAVEDQGISATQGFPNIVSGPPLTLTTQLWYSNMQARDGIVFVPALWASGDITGSIGTSWIEAGYASGISCSRLDGSTLDPTKTYFYIETVTQNDSGAHCTTPESGPPCTGCQQAAAQETSDNGTKNRYYYDPAILAGSQYAHTLSLEYASFR